MCLILYLLGVLVHKNMTSKTLTLEERKRRDVIIKFNLIFNDKN